MEKEPDFNNQSKEEKEVELSAEKLGEVETALTTLAENAEMPLIDVQTDMITFLPEEADNPSYFEEVAAQTGLSVEDLIAYAREEKKKRKK